jgi:hypothetical protein
LRPQKPRPFYKERKKISMKQNTAGFSQLMTSLVGIYFPEMVKLKKIFFCFFAESELAQNNGNA